MEHLWCYNFHSRVFFGYVVYQCATGHKINMIPDFNSTSFSAKKNMKTPGSRTHAKGLAA